MSVGDGSVVGDKVEVGEDTPTGRGDGVVVGINGGVTEGTALWVGDSDLEIGVGTAPAGCNTPRRYVTAISIRQESRCSTHGI